MGNEVFNEELSRLHTLYRDKTKVNEIHYYCKKRVDRCFVSDDFLYFHYNMYDEVDCGLVTGWGCAYRCLQMIVSFYKANFPELVTDIPKIRKIQESLALVSYIPQNKVGSQMWIEPHHAAVYVRFFLRFETREISYYRHRMTLKDRTKDIVESEKKRVGEKGFEVILSRDPSGNDIGEIFEEHFKNTEFKSVVMVDDSVSAYCIGGVRVMKEGEKERDEMNHENSEVEEEQDEQIQRRKYLKENEYQVLLFDPHVSRGFSYDSYVRNKNDMKSYGKGVKWVDVKNFFIDNDQKRWMMFFPTRTRIVEE